MGASCSMALLSQVSTSYPRVPRDSFLPSYGIFSLSGYRHFPFILLSTCGVLLHVYWLPHSDPDLSDFHIYKGILCPKVSVLSLHCHIYSIFYWKGKNGLHVPISCLSMSAYIPAIPETFRNCYPIAWKEAIIITDRKNVLHYVTKKSETRGKISYISWVMKWQRHMMLLQ